jgi:hypothetical protein
LWRRKAEPDKLASIKPQQPLFAQLLASSSGNSPDCHNSTRTGAGLEERMCGGGANRGQPEGPSDPQPACCPEARCAFQHRNPQPSSALRSRISLCSRVEFCQRLVAAILAVFRLSFHLTSFFVVLRRVGNPSTASRRGRWPCPHPSRRRSCCFS